MQRNKLPELLINNLPLSTVLAEQERQRAEVQRGRESRPDKYALNPPVVYSHENIINIGGKKYLEIQLNKRKILLPLVNIGTEKTPVHIAILNPNEKVISQNGAIELAHILQKLQVQLIITPPSSKSERMIEKAKKIARIQADPVVLVGGSTQKSGKKHIYSQAEVIGLVNNGTRYWTVECRPITLGPNDPSKFFGINETMLQKIITALQNGQQLAVVDDVVSSGETIKSIIALITKALNEKKIPVPNIPVVAVAQERPENNITQNTTPFETFSKIVIPVFTTL